MKIKLIMLALESNNSFNLSKLACFIVIIFVIIKKW